MLISKWSKPIILKAHKHAKNTFAKRLHAVILSLVVPLTRLLSERMILQTFFYESEI